MSLGTFLVLLGLILAVVSCFGAVTKNRYHGFVLPAAVILVSLGVLLGAAPLIKA